MEPDILLALARLDVAHNKPPDETFLKEAMEIAEILLKEPTEHAENTE
jgi:hypothetical protein